MKHEFLRAVSDDTLRAHETMKPGLMITTAAAAMKVVYANPIFERITGYHRDDLAGRGPHALIDACDDIYELADLKEAIDKGTATSLVVRIRRKDGVPFWASVEAEPIRDDAGKITHLLWSILDLGEQQSLHAQLLQAENLDALSQVAAGIAHDVNNVLGAIRSFGALLAEEIPRRSPYQKFAARIVSGCDRAADMIRQLLSFSGGKDAPRQRMPVARLLADVDPLIRGKMPPGVTLATNNFTRSPTIIANDSQMTQVLLNLAINGFEAMDDGGVLAISAFDFVVPEAGGELSETGPKGRADGFLYASGSLKPGGTYVKISVSDAGTGIPKDIAANIFIPFFTTKEKRRGTGLGLAIVKRIVLAHDGVVAVHSKKGAGSTFHVYLPALAEAGGPRAPETAEAGRREKIAGNERVLIVDDEVDLADAFAITLRRLGYRTAPVYSPATALELFEKDPEAWDVVVTDHSMPHMNGPELARRMKFIRPETTIILCSGSADSATNMRMEEADAVFTKPLAVEHLAASIRRLRDKRTKRKR